MREHMGLFRGKRTVNGAWIEGYLYITNEGIHEISVYETATNIERYTYIVDPDTVGECAGLPDKNGKLIFEGDVCKVCLDPDICKGKIIWDDKIASYSILFNDGQCILPLDLWLYRNDPIWIEIIGNIHDNPELLKGEG